MTCRDARLGQAEHLQRPQRIARLDDPDSVDRPLRIALDHLDLDVRAAQRERRAESAAPATHDEHPHTVTSPPPTTSGGNQQINCDSEYCFGYARPSSAPLSNAHRAPRA